MTQSFRNAALVAAAALLAGCAGSLPAERFYSLSAGAMQPRSAGGRARRRAGAGCASVR
jgi:uncharacterized lipoprotein YmbA